MVVKHPTLSMHAGVARAVRRLVLYNNAITLLVNLLLDLRDCAILDP
jgi:hypothetical protein